MERRPHVAELVAILMVAAAHLSCGAGAGSPNDSLPGDGKPPLGRDASDAGVRDALGPQWYVSTISGRPSCFVFADGGPAVACFNHVTALALDAAGNIYATDSENNRIRKIDPRGFTTTLAGNGENGYVDGTGGPTGTAEFYTPTSIAVDKLSGNVFVAGEDGYRVRKIDPLGNTTTLAGNGVGGYVDGTGGSSGTTEFLWPTGLSVDGNGLVYVADNGNNVIRRVDPLGNTTTVPGAGPFWDPCPRAKGGITQWEPEYLFVDSAKNIYTSDGVSAMVRSLPHRGPSVVLAGNGNIGYVDGSGGPSGTTEFGYPAQLVADGSGHVYLADPWNHAIRRVDASGTTTTFAGTGVQGYSDGPATTATFFFPSGLAIGPDGTLYVGDESEIRMIRWRP